MLHCVWKLYVMNEQNSLYFILCIQGSLNLKEVHKGTN